MALFDKLEGKTTDGNQSGVASSSKQPEFGMSLNFYENQGLYAAQTKANQPFRHLKPIRLVQPVLLHLHNWSSMIKIRLKTHEPIKDQQQTELRWGKTRFFQTHRSHQVKSLYLIMHLLLLLQILMIH